MLELGRNEKTIMRLWDLSCWVLMVAMWTGLAFERPLMRHFSSSPAAVRSKMLNTLEEALQNRRSCRSFNADAALCREDLDFVLWCTDGVTKASPGEDKLGHTTLPRHTHGSGGGLYPLRVFVLVERVDELDPGVYELAGPLGIDSDCDVGSTVGHASRASLPHQASALEQASGYQTWAEDAAVIAIITADRDVMRKGGGHYAEFSDDLCKFEAGMAVQSCLLACAARQLGATTIGGFDIKAVTQLLSPSLAISETPMLMVAIGHPSE